MTKLNTVKQHRLHNEGTPTLILGGILLSAYIVLGYWLLADICLPVYIGILAIPGETENVVVAPADGRVVVIEEVEENEYFHDRRLMISVFMSVTNVHANWFPVEGLVKMVRHHNGNFHKAWLPKASVDNERSTVVIETPSGHDVLVRQVAGAVARRIITYAIEDQPCNIDNHMGFIKFGSRVDVYLPLDTEVHVELGQATTGNGTVLAHLKPKQD